MADAQNTGAKSHVIGFYNLENLFDIYDDPAKNDEQYLPDGQNNWTAEKYAKKVQNMAQVIRAMKDDNGCYHTILGVSEIENRLVLEDLVYDPQIADAGFEIRQPGCSACLAMNDDKVPAGKYAVSTSNRNFEGRQGSGARTILAGPLVAAAAAITGKITDPRTL